MAPRFVFVRPDSWQVRSGVYNYGRRGPRHGPSWRDRMERDTAGRESPSLAPEHDWGAASRVIHPSLRPIGTHGIDGVNLRVPPGGGSPGHPLIRQGPAGTRRLTPSMPCVPI